MADHHKFLRDVRDHQMTIGLDQGVHRSIKFSRPGSSCYHFRLVTWPGHLAISGDMGCYVFCRVLDMFTFFRDPAMTGRINPQYWAEKADAVDRQGGYERFSHEKLANAVREDAAEWQVRLGDADKIRAEVEELATSGFSNEHEAHEAIRDFQASDGNEFSYFERSLRDWDHGYLWLCRAIVWGIKQYDLVKEGRTQADHDRRVLSGHKIPVEDRPYFDVSTTAATIPNRGAFAIYAGDKPRRTDRGVSYPLRFPMLLMTDYVCNQAPVMQAVADVLNQHGERFFPAGGEQAAHDRAVLAGER